MRLQLPVNEEAEESHDSERPAYELLEVFEEAFGEDMAAHEPPTVDANHRLQDHSARGRGAAHKRGGQFDGVNGHGASIWDKRAASAVV